MASQPKLKRKRTNIIGQIGLTGPELLKYRYQYMLEHGHEPEIIETNANKITKNLFENIKLKEQEIMDKR